MRSFLEESGPDVLVGKLGTVDITNGVLKQLQNSYSLLSWLDFKNPGRVSETCPDCVVNGGIMCS
jgi:hypothetical protein